MTQYSDVSDNSAESLTDGLSANSSDLKVLVMAAEQVSSEQVLQNGHSDGSLTNFLIHATIDGESKQILSDSADLWLCSMGLKKGDPTPLKAEA